MGTVSDLYTTGDNDPEIEPVQYTRHYPYCDACGSFELEPWKGPDGHEKIEATRERLRRAAVLTVPLLFAAGWLTFNLFPTPALALFLTLAVVYGVLVRRDYYRLEEPGVRHAWRLLGRAFLWLPVVGLVQWIATRLLPAWVVLVALSVVFVGLWVTRAGLGAKIVYRGLRCRRCQATYAAGSPFFTDMAANPRGLTVADVPRPLGSSLTWRGASVANEVPGP
jgi:hypothetical protein